MKNPLLNLNGVSGWRRRKQNKNKYTITALLKERGLAVAASLFFYFDVNSIDSFTS